MDENVRYSEGVRRYFELHPARRQGDERFAAQKHSVVNTLKGMLHILPTINRPTLYEDHELGEISDLVALLKERIDRQDMWRYANREGPVTPLPPSSVVKVKDVGGVWDMLATLGHAMEKTHHAIENLSTASLYLDFRGHDLGRNGTLQVLQIYCPAAKTVYFIHVSQLGSVAFTTPDNDGQTLRDILESTSSKKVVWDCRGATDALFAHYNVRLAAVSLIDLQLLHCAITKTKKLRERVVDVNANAAVRSRINLPHEQEKTWMKTRAEGNWVATGGPDWKAKRDWEIMVLIRESEALSTDQGTDKSAEQVLERDAEILNNGWTEEGAWGMTPLPAVMVRYAVGEVIVLPLLLANAQENPRLTPERKVLIELETAKRITEALGEEYMAPGYTSPEGWAEKDWGETCESSEESAESNSSSEASAI